MIALQTKRSAIRKTSKKKKGEKEVRKKLLERIPCLVVKAEESGK